MKTIPEMLAQMPELIISIEASAAIGAPNPSARADRHLRSVPGSRPLIDLDVWDALRSDAKGQLEVLASWSRLCAEERDGLPGPIPDQAVTWVGECRYLAAVWPWVTQQPWGRDARDEITAVYVTLTRIDRVPPEPRYRCDKTIEPGSWPCGAIAHPQPGGEWMLCESGHQLPGLGAARRQLQAEPPMTAQQLLERHGVDPGDIRRWKAAGIITPVGERRGEKGRPADLWNVYDVLQAQRGVA